MSIFGKKDDKSLEAENRRLRQMVSENNRSNKRQGQMESRQIKLLNRQLGDYKRQERDRNKQQAVTNFRNLIKRLASKPITGSRAREMMFGTGALKNMTKPR